MRSKLLQVHAKRGLARNEEAYVSFVSLLFQQLQIVAALLILFGAPIRFLHAEDPCIIVPSAIENASSIRGLKIRKSVPCFLHNKEEVRSYLQDTISTKLPPGKLKLEGEVYKSLGIVPDTFDYEHGIIRLYLEQLGGYYDPDKKHFVMAAWMPAVMQSTIAVHELTHALQDQYYDLANLIDPKLDNSDALLARSALVEGDATAVMLDYTRRLVGQGPLAKEKDVNSFMMQNLMGASMVGGLRDVPQSLQFILIFPYTSGLRFVHSLLIGNGYKKIDAAFERIPRSTEEILHPEKYMQEKADFIIPKESELAKEDEKIIYQDTLGEFVISTMLSMCMTDKAAVAEIAAGWGGDRIVVTESSGGKRRITWKALWDTQKDADEFAKAYAECLKSKSSKALFTRTGLTTLFELLP